MNLGNIITIGVCFTTLIGCVFTCHFITKNFDDTQSKYISLVFKELNEKIKDLDERLTEHLENEHAKNNDDDCK